MVPTFCSTPRASARAARREAAERSIPSAVPNSVIVTGRRHGRHGLADRLRHALGALSEDLRGDRVDRRVVLRRGHHRPGLCALTAPRVAQDRVGADQREELREIAARADGPRWVGRRQGRGERDHGQCADMVSLPLARAFACVARQSIGRTTNPREPPGLGGRVGMCGMLMMRDGSLYLEPGEVAALAAALRGAGRRPVEHPEDVLLAAVADALRAMVGGAGVTCAPARDAAMREAAVGFVSSGAAYWVPVRWPPGGGATAAPGR